MIVSFKPFFNGISLLLIILLILSQSDCLAQQNLRIFDKPGGSGTTNQQEDTGIDNTFIYVAGGAIIAGILVYALFLKKNDKKPESDTTAAIDHSKILSEHKNQIVPENYLVKANGELPVDIFFGIKNDEMFLKGKTFLLGISVKL